MKQPITLLIAIILAVSAASGQVKPKPATPKTAQEKAMEEALKSADMTEAEKKMVLSMMKGVSSSEAAPAAAEYPSFSSNTSLIPKKDIARIRQVSPQPISDQEIGPLATKYYARLMSKIPPAERTLLEKKLSTLKNASALNQEAAMALVSGSLSVGLGLSLKSVQAEPGNRLYLHNLAAILTQAGFPDKAIPLIRNLLAAEKDNSAILSNMAFAWLSLGETDSAQYYFAAARSHNPGHPEAALCAGLLNEQNGNLQAADNLYQESFKRMPNPMAEQMLKNRSARTAYDKSAYEEMIQNITVHQYFGREWVSLPVLSNRVEHFNTDRAMVEGYEKMLGVVRDKIEIMTEKASEEIDQLTEQGEEAMMKTFMTSAMSNISVLSYPAMQIQMVLAAEMDRWYREYFDELQALKAWIEKRQDQLSAKMNQQDAKCEQWDAYTNEYMREVNPRVREFFLRKLEEYRRWINAWCTWSWYVAGNPVNSTLVGNLGWTHRFEEIYSDAIQTMEYQRKHCTGTQTDDVLQVRELPLPSFKCPVVVNLPSLSVRRKLDASTRSLSADKNAPMTNATITYTAGNRITEPGRYGNPYATVSNGSIGIANFSNHTPARTSAQLIERLVNDLWVDQITADDVVPLADPSQFKREKRLTRQDLEKIAHAAATQKALDGMLSSACKETPLTAGKPGKIRMRISAGDIRIWNEETGEWQVWTQGQLKDHGILKVSVGEVELEDPKPTLVTGVGEVILEDAPPKLVTGVGEVILEDAPPKLVTGVGEVILEDAVQSPGKKEANKIEIREYTDQNGNRKSGLMTYYPESKIWIGTGEVILEDVPSGNSVQPVINNALQGPRSGKSSVIPGLFDGIKIQDP